MKKTKEKTMLQSLADWLANDAGDRSVFYKVGHSPKIFFLERVDKKIKQSPKN